MFNADYFRMSAPRCLEKNTIINAVMNLADEGMICEN